MSNPEDTHTHTIWVKRHDERYCKDCGEILGESHIDRPLVDEDMRATFALNAMIKLLELKYRDWDNLARDTWNIADAMMARRDHIVDANKMVVIDKGEGE